MRRVMIGVLILLLLAGVGIAVGEVTDGGVGAQLARFGLFAGEVSTEGSFRVGRGVTPFSAQSNTTGYTARAGHWQISESGQTVYLPMVIR